MRVPDSQTFVPVILGGDIGTYSLAREFHEAYGAASVAVPAGTNGVLEHSVAVDVRPAGSMAEDVVVEHLRRLGAELKGDGNRPLLLFGSLDLHITTITRNRASLEEYFVIPYVPLELVELAALKENFYELCAELGIAHPRTHVYDAGSGAVPDDLPYPLIGKPSDSSAWVAAKFAGKQKVHTIQTPEELHDLLGRIDASGYGGRFILQELIPGGDSNMKLATFYCDPDGRARYAAYGEVAVEEHAPIVLGNSAAIVSGMPDAAAETFVQQGRRILERLGWRGFAMFDAKLDPRDGVVKFFELNPRLGRNHYYLTAAAAAGGRDWANPARAYVRDFLGPRFEATQLPSGLTVSREEILYSVLPAPLLRQHLVGPVGERAAALLKSGDTVNPLVYRAERHPRRWFYVAAALANQFRKFKQYPPRR
ncbi:carboxylate--amine ligase [Zhihengliuella alba]|uniref:Carboxylate--amine ligase n=1 Tax=Zhihengliuella alba TaxID=547018 RepID=A0ABP7DLJ9_9MICC